jgi:hypothetical protein
MHAETIERERVLKLRARGIKMHGRGNIDRMIVRDLLCIGIERVTCACGIVDEFALVFNYFMWQNAGILNC